MPTPLPNWAGLQRLEAKVGAIANSSPLASANRFAQQQVAQTTTRTDPGTQARMAMQQTASPNQQYQQVADFKGKLSNTRQWSQQLTANAQQSAQQRRLAAQQSAVQSARAGSNKTSGQPVQAVDSSQFSGRTNSSVRQNIVKSAMSLLGTPYAWGGGGVNNRGSRGTGKGTQNVIGVDCSGLTSYAYGSIGVNLPRHSNSQTATGYKTTVKNAQPGDIIGWNRGGHVAIYLGNGQIIEAAKPGTVARVRSLGANEGVYAVRLRLPGE